MRGRIVRGQVRYRGDTIRSRRDDPSESNTNNLARGETGRGVVGHARCIPFENMALHCLRYLLHNNAISLRRSVVTTELQSLKD